MIIYTIVTAKVCLLFIKVYYYYYYELCNVHLYNCVC